MSKKMLIDAGHHEETRVVVADGSKVEEFDFEAAAKRPIRGNIYLAKVTRVEPSLQAAFVEYGGNRHGFLAFNEIHPDYYQIPYEDRVALAEEEASAVAEEDDDADDASSTDAATETAEDAATADAATDGDGSDDDADGEGQAEAIDNSADDVEDDIDDQKAARMRRQLYRKYKIQEVVKRRQVLLVQVAKEERGNKGAALTTYLSLAGRYCVLMPNTPRGGGISRKISNAADRKRLKSVVSELDLPKGVGLIIRTAGAKRTKTEIRRDADYLLRLWSNIREATLQSVAPTLIYEEGNLVKRAIRDLYDKEIDEVLVEGEAAYKEAKAFMRMLMPSHAKKVQHYKEPVPLFLRHGCENQLEAIYSPIAPLKSGGYLVINPTEALVSIDVNSGRATRERNIEATALKTNLEAASEAARQMRLRDLAGLVVIDFIDMDEAKNNRAVEKRMKDVLKRDRARLQMGRISQFGLMEISRQRRRTSLIEGSTTECPTCGGSGHLRSNESSALVALRGLEQEGTRGRSKRVRISVPTAVALYLLNDKRDHVLDIEQRFQMRVIVEADDELVAPALRIEPLESREPGEELKIAPLSVESVAEIETPEPTADSEEEGEGSGRRRRRRRRRRGGKGEDNAEGSVEAGAEDSGEEEDTEERTESSSDDDEDGAPRRRRRRGRRGGRGRRRSENANAEDAVATEGDGEAEAQAPAEDGEAVPASAEDAAAPEASEEAPAEEKPKRKRRSRRKPAEAAEASAETSDEADSASEAPAEPAAEAADESATTDEKPKRRTRRPRKTKAEKEAEAAAAATDEAPADVPADTAADTPAEPVEAEAKPKRRTRRKKAEAPAAETAAEETADTATEKPKPKRSRKKKDADAEAPVEAPVEAPAEPVAEAEPKPEPEAEAVAETAEANDASKPKRRGWWNRTGLFGN